MHRMAVTLAVLALAVAPAAARAQVVEDNFQLRNTGDLVALCAAQPTDKLFTHAQNFCHGFTLGVYRTLVAAQANDPTPMFCAPAALTQSRSQAVAAFVAWAQASPGRLQMSPVDGIAAYLAEKMPCKAGRSPG